MAIRMLAGGGIWFSSLVSAANGGAGEDWVTAKMVTEREAGRAESLRAQGRTALARSVLQGPWAVSSGQRGESLASPCGPCFSFGRD